MSHYHVFLPPILTPLGPDLPRLIFQEINVGRNVESQFDFGSSQVDRIKRLSQADAGPSNSPNVQLIEHDSLVQNENLDSAAGDLKKGKRRSMIDYRDRDDSHDRSRGMSIKRSRAPLLSSGSTSAEGSVLSGRLDAGPGSVGNEGESGRGVTATSKLTKRRSSRLDKSHSGLLGTFPIYDTTTTTDIIGIDNTNSESYLSLNTTISNSNASPYPPSADQSSVLNLPRWSIPLSKLTPLPTLLSRPTRRSKESEIISTIVCVLNVDSPVLRKRKEEKERGQEGTLWIGNWGITSPPDSSGSLKQGEGGGGGCGVKFWGEVARSWGDEVVRKGDVVLLENVSFKPSTATDSALITISDNSKPLPKITILYRTLPRYTSGNDYAYTTKDSSGAKVLQEDRLLRPDLRLGRSDLGVRKVGEFVRWFAGFIGGEAPS